MGKKSKGKKGQVKGPGKDPVAPVHVATATTSAEELTPVMPPPASVQTAPVPPVAVDRTPDRVTASSAERRIWRRVPFFRKVHYKFETMEQFRSEFAQDLSIGGMFIKTDAPESIGTVIFLEFDLKDGSKIMKGYGKVVRVNKPGTPEMDPGMGVEFLKFDDESMTRIRALVAERYAAG